MTPLPRHTLQRHRLNRVLNFAYTHLADDLDLETLADVACLSKYHFSRIFGAQFKQSPLQFLWRLRVERAARNLIYLPNERITKIALEAGFSSTQSFSQLFRKRFDMSPRAFRQTNPWPRGQDTAASLDWPKAQSPQGHHAAPKVRVKALPGYRIAYIRHVGPYFGEDCKIALTFNTLTRWAGSKGLEPDRITGVGICPDHSAFTPPELCLYDAGIVVPPHIREDDVVSIQTIPAGCYAVAQVRCSHESMNSVWEWYTSVCLPHCGQLREVLPSYEFYPPSPTGAIDPANGVELRVRLKT